jgi:hypothetical protein
MNAMQQQKPANGSNSPAFEAALQVHPCISCLKGQSAEKRACAVRRLQSEGFEPVLLTHAIPSSKIEH